MSKTPTKADLELFDVLELEQNKESKCILLKLEAIIQLIDRLDHKVNNINYRHLPT